MMPGLAASSMVFENIKLDCKKYSLHRIDWIQPKKNESIKTYCVRLSKKIKHKNPVLLGVSFGGIIAQELDKIIKVKKLIIVSSVKSHKEYPILYKIARDFAGLKVDKMVYDLYTGTGTIAQFVAKDCFKVVSISRMVPAEINQELFDKVYGDATVSSVEEFRQKLADEAKGMLDGQGKNKLRNDIVEYLLDSVKFDLPDSFLKKFIHATSKEPVSIEKIEADYDQHSSTFRWQLIENKLISDNNIKVEESEVLEKAKEMIVTNFKQFGQEVPAEELENYAKTVLGKQEEKQKMYNELYSDKIMNLVSEKCKLESKEVTYDEFVKLAAKK